MSTGILLAQFPVERTSPNGAVREDIIVWARDPNQARRVAEADGWTAVRCGAAYWNSPADYGKPRIANPNEGGSL